VLEFFPRLPFILIGDSGQQDPEIYIRVLKEYGDRVHAVYIRNVLPDRTERSAAIQTLFREAMLTHTSLQLVPDTLSAARDAAEHGWISSAALAQISGDTKKDMAPPETSLDIVSEEEDRTA
jgi:phosphatidate phosphatase APP1